MLKYIQLSFCPLCKNRSYTEKKINLNKYYFFGKELVYPKNGIKLRHCKLCGLYFKNLIPTQESIKKIYNLYGHSVWKNQTESYNQELQFLINANKKKKMSSLIDIGSSNGHFIKKASKIIPLISGLDVYRDKNCASLIKKLKGEYIISFIETKKRFNSRRYNFVSAFDVFEHLYDPCLAGRHFSDLLVKKGLLFGETGNTDVIQNIEDWWYVKYFEHHIFWNQSSLKFFASKINFKLIKLKLVAHKQRRYMSPIKRFIGLILFNLKNFEFLRKVIFAKTKIDISMIGNTYSKDHVFFSLKKN
jgi:transcription elongation factor Elf1